jgi:tetratricopeptide (TPR) repeat protein
MQSNTMQRVFQRLKGKAKPQLSPEGRQLLVLFNQLADERNRLLQDLRYALDTINVLETQLAEYDCLLEQAQSRLSGRTDLTKPRISAEAQKPQVEPSTEVAWIDDTWLCSCQNSAFLGEAEAQWKAGRPQQALIAASRALSSHPYLELADKLKCRLFIAALVHYGSKYEESNERVDSVLRTIQEQPPANYAQAREVRGIAHFIRGRNLMGLKEWHLAYWSFSKALYTPGYHSKAQNLQKEAIGNCKRVDTADG